MMILTIPMKRLFTIFSLVFISIFSGLQYTQVAAYFTDTENNWAKEYVEQLRLNCHISGYTDNQGQPLYLYGPENRLTRSELVKMLVQCSYPNTPTPTSKPFRDIELGQWYSAPIAYAKELGWVGGYSDSTFRPFQTITRAEALKIILLAKFPDNDITAGTSTFSDVSSSLWYNRFISYAVMMSFVDGYRDSSGRPTGYFGPNNTITRAEIAKIIARVFAWSSSSQPTPTPQPSSPSPSTSTSSSPTIGGCSVFPADNHWNQDISQAPVHPNSANFIASIGTDVNLHADFGGNGEYGIPYMVVPMSQPNVPIEFVEYGSESDPGPYPIPPNAPIENGSDHHVLVVQREDCKLYELYKGVTNGTNWQASSGAVFDLNSNELRPDYWTSSDAAGLPILPGLARYDEVATGEIKHALRFTASDTQRGFIHPATHFASDSDDPNFPPMGLRVRLKANYDISHFTGQARVVLEALKKYGLILADVGANWFITGASDTRWDDEDLNQLKTVPGSAFEAVNTGPIIH